MKEMTLGLQLAHLQNGKLDLRVELPKFKYHQMMARANTSLAVLLQRHSSDNQAWHMIGI